MHARAMLEQASAIHSCLGISGEVHERTTTIRWKSGEQELAEIVRGVLLDLKSALDTEEKTDESRLTKEEEKEEKKKSNYRLYRLHPRMSLRSLKVPLQMLSLTLPSLLCICLMMVLSSHGYVEMITWIRGSHTNVLLDTTS